jgi:nicotinamide-nucleotide amidase
MPHPNAVELVAIGDELLLGFTIDTNGAFLARALAQRGIAVLRRSTVGDDLQGIAAAVREALDRTGAVITTGGLGPTSDDLTRDAVALVFGRELHVDEAHLDWMRDRWRSRFGRDMPASNRRQAMIPSGARKLDNHHGSAPGVFVEDARGFVVMLPGVPRELQGMAEDTLLPLLAELGWGSDDCIRSRTLRTTGIAESLLQDRLRDLRPGDAVIAPSLAYLPGVDGVDLRITMRGAASAEVLSRFADDIRRLVPDHVYADDDTDLARVLLDLCRADGLRIAVAESCTGGLLGARLTAVPGSSDVFVGGVIAYSDEVKTAALDVPDALLASHGAVSEPVVRQMAAGALRRFNAQLGLAITGVAGPGGGTPEKPVGLVWVCAAVADRVEARRLQSWGDRQEVRYRATQAAMDLGRRMLMARASVA